MVVGGECESRECFRFGNISDVTEPKGVTHRGDYVHSRDG